MAESPNVALTLSNSPQNVWLVREMLSGVAEVVELDRSDLDDVRTAVTEACNNVALHAYVGARGPLEVDVYAHPDALDVVVRDRGIGFPSQLTSNGHGGGLGLQIMRALTRRLELRARSGKGSEARMEFATPGALGLYLPGSSRSLPPQQVLSGADGAVGATIAPARLTGAVLRRVLSMLAAHAHFSTDRIGDVQLLADALAAAGQDPESSTPLGLAVGVEPRALHLRVGPLESGAGRQLISRPAAPGLEPLIAQLADAHRVTSAGRYEMLSMRLSDRR